MSESSHSETALLLRAWAHGDQGALELLIPRVYVELRRIAARCLRNRKTSQTIQTTALVNEAYMRLVDLGHLDWQDRTHFFACSAQIMRRILLDTARRRIAAKRGGGAVRVDLDESSGIASAPAREVIALDDALTELARVQPRKARIVELRFYGGLSVEETAAVLGVSPDTVERDWKLAKLWLRSQLGATH